MTCWPEGYGRRVLASVDSTLSEAARTAADLTGPQWILALEQTAARGRRGRVWVHPVGNFAATLVVHPDEAPGVAALRSFVMSLALLRACVAVTGRNDVFSLKWPNDVLLQGGKVAGILLESAGQGRGVSHLAIGVGVNLIAAPAQSSVEQRAVRPVSLWSETGVRLDPEQFLDALAAAYAPLEQQFLDFGFAPIRAGWMAHAARLGQVITARTGQTETTGTFEDVDADGNLILTTAHGRVAIAAADVFF
jgi:BirA family biotin operon repressor/biotin-[acetyl-CoA-carboxylase] ligase